MAYPDYVEVCGNCHSLITWDKNNDPICNCGNTKLQFILREDAIKLGILKGG